MLEIRKNGEYLGKGYLFFLNLERKHNFQSEEVKIVLEWMVEGGPEHVSIARRAQQSRQTDTRVLKQLIKPTRHFGFSCAMEMKKKRRKERFNHQSSRKWNNYIPLITENIALVLT